MRNPNADVNWHKCSPSSDRRIAARLAHAERVSLATSWGDVDGALVDVSSTGGQVRIVNGLVPFEGEEVTLRFVGAGQYSGRIAWAGDETVGIAFDQPIVDVAELLWLEQRGPEWYGRAALAGGRKFVWG